jgi:hypothetical protein
MNQACRGLLSILAAVGLAACGGTASGTPTVVAVTVAPTSGTVAAGNTLQFAAKVTGSSNVAVTWSVQESGGGSVTAAGLYTAPGTAGTYHVVATSAADTTKSASAAVTVTVTLAPRTVSGTFSTIWQKDDGTETTVAGLGPNQSVPTALLFPDGAGGLTSVALTVGADGSFSVPNVPGGMYYLRADASSFPVTVTGQQAESLLVTLTPLTSSTPDLSTLLHGRADAVAPTKATPVTLHVTGLAPWTSRGGSPFLDHFFTTTAQASGNHDVFQSNPPAAGATTADATIDWQNSVFEGLSFLPDAAKGDTTYFYHRAATTLANGGKAVVATRFAKSTTFTVLDGGGTSVTVDLQAAPLTSSLPTAGKLSAFAALVPGMNPSASLADPSVATAGASLFAIPGSLSFPDLPGFNVFGRLAFYVYLGGLSTDTDYGAINYGGFLDPSFHVMRNFSYEAGVTLSADNGSVTFFPAFTAQEPADGVGSTLAPVLGPVQTPLINGVDAFTARTGVGLTPTLSWSAPSLGSAGWYAVTVQMLSVPDGPTDVGQISVAVYDGTSFKIPAGMLKAGKTYAAFITAENGLSDQNRPFRFGLPAYGADALTNTFTP